MQKEKGDKTKIISVDGLEINCSIFLTILDYSENASSNWYQETIYRIHSFCQPIVNLHALACWLL